MEEILTSAFDAFLRSGVSLLRIPEFLDRDQVARLLKDVRTVMEYPIGQHVSARRLAFASEEALTYPSTEAQVGDLIATQTAVVQSLELSSGCISSVAAALRDATGRRVSASAYVSSPCSAAFDYHVDHWDSLVIQLEGSKTFEFSDDGGPGPQLFDRLHELCPRDVLLFTSAAMHRTTTVTPSLHLSFAVRR